MHFLDRVFGNSWSVWLGIALLLGLSAAAAASVSSGARPSEAQGKRGRQSKAEASRCPSEPLRVASTTLQTDELVVALVGPKAVVAVSQFADSPSASHVAYRVSSIPHRVDAAAEELIGLEPSLVLTSAFTRPQSRALYRLAGLQTVQVAPSRSVEEVARAIRTVGRALCRAAQAEALVQKMNEKLRKVAASVPKSLPRPRVLLLQAGGHTAGRGTLFDQVLQLAGGINAASEAGIEGHAALPLEHLLKIQPDVVLFNGYRADGSAKEGATLHRRARELMMEWAEKSEQPVPRFKTIPATAIVTTSHHVADAAETLHRTLYPHRASDEP